MNKSDSGDLAEAIRRAESRAAVIQSLKLSYGSTKPKVAAVAVAKSSITTECAKLPVKEKTTVHINQSNNNPIDSKLPYPVLPLGGANTLPGKSSSSSSKTESSGYGNLKSTARAADLIVQVFVVLYKITIILEMHSVLCLSYVQNIKVCTYVCKFCKFCVHLHVTVHEGMATEGVRPDPGPSLADGFHS